jgi:hypothetical protein
MTTKPPLQKILKTNLYTKDENKHSNVEVGTIKSQEKSRQIIREQHSIGCTHTNLYTTKKLNVKIKYTGGGRL